MTRWIVAFLLFAVLLLGGRAPSARGEDAGGGTAAACVVCRGTQKVACPTCGGTGRLTRPCTACAGTGHLRCSRRVTDLAASDAPADAHTGTDIACPNHLCVKGTITWTDGRTSTCKLCGGTGKARCMECQLAAAACGACSGKGNVEIACDDCAGAGQFACVACADRSPQCTQCGGKLKLPCAACRATGTSVVPCATCAARGVVACAACRGLGRIACPDCDATGRYRAEFQDHTQAASTHCPKCDGRGTQTCANCTGGRARCSACDGAKQSKSPCETCGGTGRSECRSCGDWRLRAAELESSRLAAPTATPEETRAAIAILRPTAERATALSASARAEADRIDRSMSDLTGDARTAARSARSAAEHRAAWFGGIAERCKATLERIQPPPQVK